MPLSGTSHPSAYPALTPPTSPSGWLPCSPPLQAPDTPSTPPCPFSEGCLQGAPPRDTTGWAPKGTWQAQAGESTESSKSGFSGTEMAPSCRESHFFNFLQEDAFSCFGSGGNLTSEKAEMKRVWVEIRCYFAGLRESSRTFFRGTSPVGLFLLPRSRRPGCSQLPHGGWGRARCGLRRPRSPRASVEPHQEQRLEIILHAAQTQPCATLRSFDKITNSQTSPLAN